MKPRPFIPNDIVQISFAHLPVSKRLGEMAQFHARIKNISSVEENPGWIILHWEQKSNDKHGMILVPPEGENIPFLPRVRFVKRPK